MASLVEGPASRLHSGPPGPSAHSLPLPACHAPSLQFQHQGNSSAILPFQVQRPSLGMFSFRMPLPTFLRDQMTSLSLHSPRLLPGSSQGQDPGQVSQTQTSADKCVGKKKEHGGGQGLPAPTSQELLGFWQQDLIDPSPACGKDGGPHPPGEGSQSYPLVSGQESGHRGTSGTGPSPSLCQT